MQASGGVGRGTIVLRHDTSQSFLVCVCPEFTVSELGLLGPTPGASPGGRVCRQASGGWAQHEMAIWSHLEW